MEQGGPQPSLPLSSRILRDTAKSIVPTTTSEERKRELPWTTPPTRANAHMCRRGAITAP
jgi:hypothetical protein